MLVINSFDIIIVIMTALPRFGLANLARAWVTREYCPCLPSYSTATSSTVVTVTVVVVVVVLFA